MEIAVIYKDKKGYIFTPMALTEAGFSISIEPEVRIYFNAGATTIANALREVVAVSRGIVKTPIYNRKKVQEQREAKKERERKLDIVSFAVLNRKPVKLCQVFLKDGIIKFAPQMHDPQMSGIGYTGLDEEEDIFVQLAASDELVLMAIEKAFSKCK